MVIRYRSTVAYDGTAYQGFQRQIGRTPTIQLALEDAIAETCGQQVTVIGAGRTDTGVHASGQVIAFDVEWRHGDASLIRAINARLPDDIALQDIRQQEGFHPRFDALSRLYRYTIVQSLHRQPLVRHRAWHVWGKLDRVAMQQAADLLIGGHDFATFGKPPQGNNTVRNVFQSSWLQEAAPYGTNLVYCIEGDAFLQHMVRRIVWMIAQVGLGKQTVAGFEAAFRRAKLAEAGTIAPPHGLILESVRYPQHWQQPNIEA